MAALEFSGRQDEKAPDPIVKYYEYRVHWPKSDAEWIFNTLSTRDQEWVKHIDVACMTPADALKLIKSPD